MGKVLQENTDRNGDTQTSRKPNPAIRAEAFAAALILISAVQIAEGLLPRIPIFPWLKIGLSFALALPILMEYGTMTAVALLLGRNALSFLLTGQPFSTFIIGTLATIPVFFLFGEPLRFLMRSRALGYVGASIAMAALQNVGQLLVAGGLIIQHRIFFAQLPLMLAWSLISGTITGLLAAKAHAPLCRLVETVSFSWEPPIDTVDPRKAFRKKMVFFVSWARLALVLVLPYRRVQSLMFVATLLILTIPRLRKGESIKPIFAMLLRAWPWFMFLGVLHLVAGEGHLIAGGLLTHEGFQAFIIHALRLGNVILVGPRLAETMPRAWLVKAGWPKLRGFGLAMTAAPKLLALDGQTRRAMLADLRQGRVEEALGRVMG